MDNALDLLESRRKRATGGLHREHRSNLGQFFTPGPVAVYMASLLDFTQIGEVLLLDPGAGIGSLTVAAARKAGKRKIRATCYELEPSFQEGLKETLGNLPNVVATVESRDYPYPCVRASRQSLRGR